MLPIDTIFDYVTGILSNEKIIILTGETGSGKTLKVPQIAYFLGVSLKKKILCTEPRRIAVFSAAKEISKQMGTNLGSLIGYSIRFEEFFNSNTKVKFITEGLFIKQCLLKLNLKEYSILIIDEAHERSSNTDIILSLIRNQIILKTELKVILMSATIDTERFSKFFFDCPVFCIPGRNFSVISFFSRFTCTNFILNAIKTIFKILKTTSRGNILVFLRGKFDIDKLGQILFSVKSILNFDSDYEIFPIFSEISTKAQLNVLESLPNKRKIILATNIAEASITLPNIHFVLDTGISKISYFDLKWNIERLSSRPIKQSNASQRSGRTGRTHNGRCFKLYTKWSLKNEMKEIFSPEIQRTDLCGIILFFKSLGLRNLNLINWLDRPPKILFLFGLKTLYLLGAVNRDNHLTNLGRKLVELPIKPMLGKSLISSHRFNCKKEILYLSSILSVPSFKTALNLTQGSKDPVNPEKSDQMIYSNFFKKWKKSGYSYQWCKENKINFNEIINAKNIEFQLQSSLKKFRVTSKISKEKEFEKALISGFFLNIAKLTDSGCYRPVFSRSNSIVNIFPESKLSIFPLKANFVLFDHLFLDLKIYMKIISVLNSENLKIIYFCNSCIKYKINYKNTQ